MIEVNLAPEHAATIRQLDTLADELKTKAVRSGLTAAAKPIKRTMALLAPTKTGLLKQSIGQTSLSTRAINRLELFGQRQTASPGEVAILIGPNRRIRGRRRARLANILEQGAKPHAIRAPRGGILKLFPGFARKIKHPGIKPTRFMERSLQANESQIEGLFFQGVEKRIGKLI